MAQPEGLGSRGDIARRRCLHHGAREAAARCPACGRYFCRECVSEHAGRWLCAACLAGAVGVGRAHGWSTFPWLALRATVGLLVAWFYFYLAGQALLTFHDPAHGTDIGPEAEETR